MKTYQSQKMIDQFHHNNLLYILEHNNQINDEYVADFVYTTIFIYGMLMSLYVTFYGQ